MSRIKQIVKLIDPVDTLIDIGTDHGKVIIEAFKQNKIKKAIATDINDGPLNSAYENISEYDFINQTTFCKTDGFFGIKDSFDAAIITGMGYKTIEHILMMDHHKPKYYILGPQRQLNELRLFLNQNNFKIIDEAVFYDKKYYVFIKITQGKQTLSEEDYLLGPILKTKKEAIKYYKNIIKEYRKIMDYQNNHDNSQINSYIKILENGINKLK